MIVLDTHAWVWLVGDPKSLSSKARRAMDAAMEERAILISSISAWEVSMLVKKKRLRLTMEVNDWLEKSEALPFLRFIPVDNKLAVRAVNLPGNLHADPADRIITATAITMGAPLVTKDRRLRNYSHVKTIW